MSAEENIRARLETLLAKGVLARSACGQSLLEALIPLLDSCVVVEERSGAGRRFRVRDAAAFREFFLSRYPDAPVFTGASSRVAALARFRDTKSLSGDTPIIVLLRAWSDSALSHNGQPVPAASLTRQHGVFSFVLGPQCAHALHAPCALVENPAVFLAFERLALTSALPAALYAGGRAPGRLLEWLASQPAPGFHLTHFPDYDPVGLSEFIRVHSALGHRAGLHLPASLSECFSRFANRDLLRHESSRALLSNLRSSSLPEVRAVLDLMDRHNGGLEQESLLLASNHEADDLRISDSS